MADKYCDPTLGQAAYADYATTPTASGTVPTKCEDGNGKASGVASMATLVITFTGIPTANEAITIAGVTFTAKASGATGNQFNCVTDAATCATNLKNAINASTTNAVQPASEIAATAPLRNIVNATSSAGVVTVYTRIGSAAWNSVTENETLTNATITAQWSGGTDGAWGYLFNVAAIAWPTSVAAGAYGAQAAPYLDGRSNGDIVHIRTKRSGADVTITAPSTTFTVTTPAIGIDGAPLTFLADNGVKWSGDAGTLIISIPANGGAHRSWLTPNTTGVNQVWAGAEVSAGVYNWRWELTGTHQTGTWRVTVGATAGSNVNTLSLERMSFTGASNAAMANQNNSWCMLQFQPCASGNASPSKPRMTLKDVVVKSQSQTSPIVLQNATYRQVLKLDNYTHDAAGLTSTTDKAMFDITGHAFVEAQSSKWINFPASANQSGVQYSPNSRDVQIVLRDCVRTNIKMSGGLSNGGVLGQSAPSSQPLDQAHFISESSSIGGRNFIFENYRQSFVWVDSAAPSHLASLLPSGSPFSVRVGVTTDSTEVNKSMPVVFSHFDKHNTLSSGSRTATLALLVDANINTLLGRAPRNDEMWVVVTYENTSGGSSLVTTRAEIGAAPVGLTAGTSADWSATTYDVNGIGHTYAAYEIAVSLPSVAAGATIGLRFATAIAPSSIDDLVFLGPEWELT